MKSHALFENGDLVFLRASIEPRRGMVTGIVERPGGSRQYLVTWGDDAVELLHLPVELSDKPTPEFA